MIIIPPHFHAIYGDEEALVGIEDLRLLRGRLPRRAWLMVREWAYEHRHELLRDWDLAHSGRAPLPIAPLDLLTTIPTIG